MARNPRSAPRDFIQSVSRAVRILEAVGGEPEGLASTDGYYPRRQVAFAWVRDSELAVERR